MNKSKRKSIVYIIVIAILLIVMTLLIIPLNGENSITIGDTNYEFYWVSSNIKLGLDLEGGMYAVFKADLKNVTNPDGAMEGTIANLESLLFSKGYTEAVVTRQGDNEIRVEVPSIQDTETLISLIGKPAKLEFKDESGKVIIEGSKHIKDVAVQTSGDGKFVIALEFNEAGTKAFADGTTANVGKKMPIYIDGQKIMEPDVSVAITTGKAIIQGDYDYESATEMAVKIKSGALGLELDLQQAESISPTLGKDALYYGIMAAFIGLLMIFALMLIVYKGLGVCASVALIIYTVLLVYLLAIVPWVQLTLPGIAGVILSIGMAVDANVVIFERIKDEKRNSNKGIPSAVKSGFKKAVVAIIDANVTTIFGAIVMMIFGATAIQSFAITLLIGILLSMFTSLFVTRFLIDISLSFNDDSNKYYGLNFKEVAND